MSGGQTTNKFHAFLRILNHSIWLPGFQSHDQGKPNLIHVPKRWLKAFQVPRTHLVAPVASALSNTDQLPKSATLTSRTASRQGTTTDVVVHEKRYAIDENHYVVPCHRSSNKSKDAVPIMPPGNFHVVGKTAEGLHVLQNSTSLDRMMWDMVISKLNWNPSNVTADTEYRAILENARGCFPNLDELICVDAITGGALTASCFPKLFERNSTLPPHHPTCYAGVDQWVVSVFCHLFGPHGNCGLNVRSPNALYGIGVELFYALNEFRLVAVDPEDYHLLHSFGHGGVGYLLAMQAALTKHLMTAESSPEPPPQRREEAIKEWWCCDQQNFLNIGSNVNGDVLRSMIPQDDASLISASVAHSIDLGKEHFAKVCRQVCIPLLSKMFTDVIGLENEVTRNAVFAFLDSPTPDLSTREHRKDWVRQNFSRLAKNTQRLVHAYDYNTKEFSASSVFDSAERLTDALENRSESTSNPQRLVVKTALDHPLTPKFPFQKVFPGASSIYLRRPSDLDRTPPVAVQLNPKETCALLWVSSE